MPPLDADRIVALLVLQFLVAALLWVASPRHRPAPLPGGLRPLPFPLPGAGIDARHLWLPGLMVPAGLLFFSGPLEPVWRSLVPLEGFTGIPVSLAAAIALASWGLQAQLGRLATLTAPAPEPSPPRTRRRTSFDAPILLLPLAGTLWLGGWSGLALGGGMALWALLLAGLLQAPPAGPSSSRGRPANGRSDGAHGGHGPDRAAPRDPLPSPLPAPSRGALLAPLLATLAILLLLVLTPLGTVSLG